MTARSAQGYLHICSGRWQWRIEDVAEVEIRHAVTHEVIRTLTPAQIVLMALHLEMGAQMVAETLEQRGPHHLFRRPLASAPSRAPLRALGVPLRPVQAQRQAARASRAGRAGRKRTTPP
jgi:hypothetical protein